MTHPINRRQFIATGAALAAYGCATGPKDDVAYEPVALDAIRGAVYTPSYACNSVVAWERFSERVIDRELGYAARLNLNSVRVFLQYVVYEKNPTYFVTCFDRLVSLCGKHGLTLTPVLFDAVGEEPVLGKYKPNEKGPWCASPGVSREDHTHWPKLDAYIRDVVEPHAKDPRIALWDCVNEPIRPTSHPLARHTIEYIKALGARQPVSSCWGVGDAIGDVVLLHEYDWNHYPLEGSVRLAQLLGRPVVVSNLADLPGKGYFAKQIPECAKVGVGWYAWELMDGARDFRFTILGRSPGAYQEPFRGILLPNGSVRDPEEAKYIDGTWLKDVDAPIVVSTSPAMSVDVPVSPPVPGANLALRKRLAALRGANYIPSYACSGVVQWEHFNADVIDRELGWAREIGLNSIRFYLQYLVHEKDPVAFGRNLDKVLDLCEKHGLTMAPVLFDSCGHNPELGKNGPYDKDLWRSSPGHGRETPDFYPKLDRYIRDMVEPRRQDPRIEFWDCFNEPFFQWPVTQALAHRSICKVKELDPTQPVAACFGIGDAFGDIVCIHTYSDDMARLEEIVANARRVRGEVLITEMAGRPSSGDFKDLVPTCARLDIGWYFWELMVGSTVFANKRTKAGVPYQGVIHPDGSYYDPDEIRYISGSWRNAGGTA